MMPWLGLGMARVAQTLNVQRDSTIVAGIKSFCRDFVKGKKVLDIGCGLGFDSIFFAETGATVTFVDIVRENIKLVERICHIKGWEIAVSW